MKKIFLLLFALAMLFVCAGCGEEEIVHDENDMPFMIEGEVLSLSGAGIKIKTEEYDQIVVSTGFLEGYGYKSDTSNISIGDRVRVLYDGRVAESYPPQILSVYQIYEIEE